MGNEAFFVARKVGVTRLLVLLVQGCDKQRAHFVRTVPFLQNHRRRYAPGIYHGVTRRKRERYFAEQLRNLDLW